MPKMNDEVTCINGHENTMMKDDQLTALLPVERDGNDVAAWLGQKPALFLDAFVCSVCGYVEIYKK